ncbi:transmembrane protein 198-like isoform X2 [Denticeps clupeoides]|nr:transmembrane protein 198-like isoform X2 [Denticeps clupeoides]
MFLSGLVLGLGVSYPLAKAVDPQMDTESHAGLCLGAGILVGAVTLLVKAAGLFVTGLQLGLLLSAAALLAAGQHCSLSPAWVPLGIATGAGVSCGVLALLWQKAFAVSATAALGAAVVTACADYCVETPVLGAWVRQGLRREAREAHCWYTWVVLASWPALGLLGALVQWRLTAHGVSHTQVIVSRRQKQVPLMRIRQRELRRPAEGMYRQRPPPLKRYAGDVLAPSYLRSLQERQMGTGSSQSSQSTGHHTMIDFDFETGSMVPLTTSSSILLQV